MTTAAGSTARALRLGVLAVAALSMLATGYELGAERHWRSTVQLVPWVALLVLLAAIVLAALALPGRIGLVRPAQGLAALALVASAFGVYEHVSSNRSAGPLDQAYSDTWDSRDPASQWLLAATKSVGPAPPLAPGALGQSALLVLLATAGLRKRPEAPASALTPSRTSG